MRIVAAGVALAAAVLVSACAPQATVYRFNPGTVVGQVAPHRNACGFRLGEVVDARGSDNGGALQIDRMVVEDLVALVRRDLLAAGLRPVEDGDGPLVRVEIRQFYMRDNLRFAVPVVVYLARIGDAAPIVVRGQPSAGLGSSNGVLKSMSQAMRLADDQLMEALATRCAAS